MNYLNKKFFMVRHGETVANQKGVAAGVFDTPLTEKGKQQANELEKAIFNSGIKFDYIVHSGLSRAMDTAAILNMRFNLPLVKNQKISEQNYGRWQGMNWKDMMSQIRAGDHPPDGESQIEFFQRAMEGIKESVSAMPGVPLLVTHGGIFDACFAYLKLDNIDVENCTLYECVIQEVQGKIYEVDMHLHARAQMIHIDKNCTL